MGRSLLSLTFRQRHALQLLTHAHSPQRSNPYHNVRRPLRPHTQRLTPAIIYSTLSTSQHEQRLLPYKNLIFSTLPHHPFPLVSPSRLAQGFTPSQPSLPSTSMETTHQQPTPHTPLHFSQRHSTSTVPYRQAGPPPRGPRATKSAHLLPAALLPRLPHHLEYTTTISTATPFDTRSTPYTPGSVILRQSSPCLSLGISQAFLDAPRRSVPQTEEILAQGPYGDQLFPLYRRHPTQSNVQSLGH